MTGPKIHDSWIYPSLHTQWSVVTREKTDHIIPTFTHIFAAIMVDLVDYCHIFLHRAQIHEYSYPSTTQSLGVNELLIKQTRYHERTIVVIYSNIPHRSLLFYLSKNFRYNFSKLQVVNCICKPLIQLQELCYKQVNNYLKFGGSINQR